MKLSSSDTYTLFDYFWKSRYTINGVTYNSNRLNDYFNKPSEDATLNSAGTNHEIEKDVITKINYITDTYETINDLISAIDKENSSYTKSSASKILYLNNSDRTIKGHLENIFKYYGKNSNDSRKLASVLNSMMKENFRIQRDLLSLMKLSQRWIVLVLKRLLSYLENSTYKLS